jgi:hypothetical protein
MAKATKKATDTQAKVNIPAAVRDGQPQPGSVDDELAALLGQAAPAPKKGGKDKRPEMELDAEAQEVGSRYAPAKKLFDHFKTHHNNVRGEFIDICNRNWARMLWQHKTQPGNPKLSIEKDGHTDITGLFVKTAKFSVDVPDEKNPVSSMVASLVNLGVEQADAEKLVAEELDFRPQSDLKFGQLQAGYKTDDGWVPATDASKTAALKIIKYALQSKDFTDDERAAIKKALVSKPSVRVKDGFLQRVCQYAHSQDQLDAILTVIKPQEQLRSIKFGVSDSLDTKTARLIEYASSVLGTELGLDEEEEDD